MATRIRRKELRRPDEFVTATSRAFKYAQEHQRTVGWATAGLIAVALVVAALVTFRYSRWQQANTSLARGMSLFSQNKMPDAVRAFDEMIAQPSNPQEFVEIARLYSGQAQLRQGEFARAAADFDAIQGGVDGFLQQRALLNHAYALEGNQQFEDAAHHFDRAASTSGPYTAIAVLGAGRNWERAGDAAKAKAAYEKYVTEFPDAPDKQLVEAHLASFGQ